MALIYDPSGVIKYRNGDKHYTRTDQPGVFVLRLDGQPVAFVDTARYLGVVLNKDGDWQATAEAVFTSGNGKMWAILAKIRSLFTLPWSFAIMLYSAIVQGAQTYGSEIWLALVEPHEADRTFVQFDQHLFHLHRKTGKHNVFLLGNTLPFSIWARKHAVLFLLRCLAAPCDSLLHQCLVKTQPLHPGNDALALRWA